MKVVGTIVEYNPLHTGHIYALKKIKELAKADVIVAVMSGNFTMRGDLSLFDKFTKTKQALLAGIDLVIELPTVYTCQSSDIFAAKAVELLALAKVEEIWFGSEKNDPSLYEKYYEKWQDHNIQKQIKEYLNSGISYKAATAKVFDLESNDQLGFSYFKAIRENNYQIQIKTIKRIGSGFLDLKPQDYASSYAIRHDLSLLPKYCPNYVDKNLIRAEEKLFDYLKYQLIATAAKDLAKYFLVSEGLENRLKKSLSSNNYEDLLNFLTNKRYIKSRIKRMLVYILLQITKSEINSLNEVNYIRVLGYKQAGLDYLNKIKHQVKIFTNIKETDHDILAIELKVSKIVDLIFQSSTLKLEQGKPIFIP